MSNEQTNEQAPQSGLAEALSEATAATQETSETNTATPPATPPAEEATQPAAKNETQEKNGHSIETMEDALKVIADLRAENAKSRTTAKEQAAEQARADLIAKLSTALGITTDEEETPDPEQAASRLAAEVEQERAAAKTAALELAVYRAATSEGVNADMLLDSRSFADAITDLDPGDSQAISDAINNVVQSRPELRQVQATGPTRTDHTPGGQDSAQPINVSDAVASFYR